MFQHIQTVAGRTLAGWIVVVLLLPLSIGIAPKSDTAQAAAADLFFSEYVEGSSNNKALELFNGTGAAVDLTAGDYVIEFYFGGNTAANTTINLSGTVADGEAFVVADDGATAAILAEADQTSTSGFFNGDDAIVLKQGGADGTVLDVIGQIGNDPGDQWGSDPTSTQDNTLRRKAAVCAGDTDPDDAFDPAAEWDGFAADTFVNLGEHVANCDGDAAPVVISTIPTDGTTGVNTTSEIVVTFNEPVTVTAASFDLDCTTSDAIAVTVTGGPLTYTVTPDTAFARDETCTMTVVAAQVVDDDTDDPPDNLNADTVVNFAVVPSAGACAATATPIHAIQGSGTASPLLGEEHIIEGIVAASFPGLEGFYVQEELDDADTDDTTSEGIFVFMNEAFGTPPVTVGNVVRVAGTVAEFESSSGASSQTQLTGELDIVDCGAATESLTPVAVSLPLAAVDDLERYEGMLVRFPQDLVISEYFNFDRFGEIVLALPLDGQERPIQPTSIVMPGATATELAQAYAVRRITLDDGRAASNPDPARHPNGEAFTLDNRFRGGDLVMDATGMLDETFGNYRIQPTTGATYTAQNPRLPEPEDVGGSLKVASFNVLNYFTTLDDETDQCGPSGDLGCRGADANQPNEFERQRTKIISALATINADIVGIIEVENNATAAVQDLVNGLNTELGADTYTFIDTGTIGTDAIKVALLYKPATVTPVGAFAILDASVDARFIDDKNRPALAQAFEEQATGERVTVAVNHFKSKGSSCDDIGDPNAEDGQGNCNGTRTQAAQALVEWLATDPTGSADPDMLIIGDLNAYAMEDPIRAIEDSGYTNLIERFQGAAAYSFVFSGLFGYLDHALANASLAPQTTGVTEWHINADEPDILDYDTSFKKEAQEALFEANAFRSSDHDPVIVGLELGALRTYLPLVER